MESLNMICIVSLLLLSLSIHSASAAAAAHSTDFICTSCNVTLYPDICYATLSPYTNIININKDLLAETAISVSLRKSKSAAAFVSRQAAAAGGSGAVEECVSALKDAVDQARESLTEMKKIIGKPVESVRMEVSNVQTWMSAALTNQGTCIDALEEVKEDGAVKREVVKRSEVAKKVTSNALAFINMYVNA